MRIRGIRTALLIAASCLLLTACGAKKQKEPPKTEEKSISHYEEALSDIDGAYDGTEDSEWLKSVVKTAGVMADNRFSYDRGGIKSTLDKALDDNRHGDCAHLISWALQDYGILESGETFYSNSSGNLSCSKDSPVYDHLKKRCDIIDAGGIRCSDTEKLKSILHPGDICCYNLHMNVVAGIDEKGNILYYDAGLVPTEKEGKKIYYTEKLTRPFSRKTPAFKRYRLYTIIRIKK